MKLSDGRVMESECEREKEWGKGQFLQAREEGGSGYKRERCLRLERVGL